MPKRKPPSFAKELENSLQETAKKMDGQSSAGSTPKMDWSNGDLPNAFKQHCEFTFGGPLKQKSEEKKKLSDVVGWRRRS